MIPDQTFRLSTVAYEELEKKILSNILVNDKTTEIQAGYMLGIQLVLKALRDGYVISNPR